MTCGVYYLNYLIYPDYQIQTAMEPDFIGPRAYRTTLFPCRIDSAKRLVMTGLR